MVEMNCLYGPFEDDPRYQQVVEAWTECKTNHNARSCALFQSRLPELLAEAGGVAGLTAMGLEGDIDEMLWEDFTTDCPLRNPETKVNLNRFFDTTRRAKKELTKWERKLTQFEYCAIESGLLASGKFQSIEMKAPSVGEVNDDHKASTDGNRLFGR